jgi:hypothetical protein
MQKLLAAKGGGRKIDISRVCVLCKNRHDRRHKIVVSREAVWCLLFWKDGDETHENVDCVRVAMKDFNCVHWDHVMSFLIGQLGVIYPDCFFDE